MGASVAIDEGVSVVVAGGGVVSVGFIAAAEGVVLIAVSVPVVGAFPPLPMRIMITPMTTTRATNPAVSGERPPPRWG